MQADTATGSASGGRRNATSSAGLVASRKFLGAAAATAANRTPRTGRARRLQGLGA